MPDEKTASKYTLWLNLYITNMFYICGKTANTIAHLSYFLWIKCMRHAAMVLYSNSNNDRNNQQEKGSNDKSKQSCFYY